MNSISPALAHVSTPVKSSRGMEQNSKIDSQSDTKFQLPEKKSKDNSENVANQNDADDNAVVKDDTSMTNGATADDAGSTHNAEMALLELINSYQPKNADKSEAADDENSLLVDDHEDNTKGGIDPNVIASDALAQPNTNNKSQVVSSMIETTTVPKSTDTQINDAPVLAEKPKSEKAQINGDAAKSAVLANPMQEKDEVSRHEGQKPALDSSDGKKPAEVLNAEKPMSGGGKDQGSKQNDDRAPASNLSLVDKSGTKMAGVEVLEAKTFIAPANTSANANNISQAILKSQQISSAAAAQNSEPVYQTSQPKALNTLKIQLNPAELGVVTATMKLNGDNLQVQLRVENIDAYRLLSEDSSSIVKALKGQGFGIDQINLTLASSDRGGSQQGNPQNGQSFQSHTDQEQMKNQSGNDQNNGSKNSKGAEGLAPANEPAQQETAEKDTYSGGVYL